MTVALRRVRTTAALAVVALVAVLVAPGAARAVTVPGADCNTGSQILPETPWQVSRLGYDRVWGFARGFGIRVAVLDTGVDASHPQLAGAVEAGTDTTPLPPPSEGTPPPIGPRGGDTDCTGHGTFVAGLIAARPQSGTGVAGVAPGATIFPVRVAVDPEEGSEAALAAGIEAATAADVDVINISIVTYLDAPELRSAVEAALAAGIVVVAAAGNDGGGANRVTYPAAYPGVIAVGAIEPDGTLASYSQTSVPISVVAPGTDVVSTIPGTGHAQQSGTSFAAPLVSGVAAIVLASDRQLTPAAVKHRIEATADPPAGPLPGTGMGWGVVNPYQAVTAILPPPQVTTTAEPAAALPPLVIPPPPDTSAQDRAVAVGVAALVVLVVALLARVVVPAGRRRGWRPGTRGDPSAEARG